MSYGGSYLFQRCVDGEHERCENVTVKACTQRWFECACGCHSEQEIAEREARECAGANDERPVFPSARQNYEDGVRAIFGGPF